MPAPKVTQTTQLSIQCRGVRTHNLKNIDVDFPLYKWTVVTGVSGSGKSSLVFDTLFAEAQRRFLETLGAYERQFLQGLPQGEFNSIEPIPPAIALKQIHRASADPRSVVGTASDIIEPLRMLFIQNMIPSCVKCAGPVVRHEPSHVLEAMDAKKPAVLCVYIEFPKKNPEDYLKSLLFEGFSRIFEEGSWLELESLDAKKWAGKGTYLILDRLFKNMPGGGALTRIQKVWSQLLLSPKQPFLWLGHGETKELERFFVKPYCNHCQTPTQVLEARDLDWNSVLGACTQCNGMGSNPHIDPMKVIPDGNLSVAENAIKPWSSDIFFWMAKEFTSYLKRQGIDSKVPYNQLPQNVKDTLWHGDKNYKGVTLNDFFNQLRKDRYKMASRVTLSRYTTYLTCEVCKGTRLGEKGQRATCHGKTFSQILQEPVSEVEIWLKSLSQGNLVSKETHGEVWHKVKTLTRLGLSSQSLNRPCKTLSGGEYQRVLLTRVLGNGLTDALYVLDEPSLGLGKGEIPQLIQCIQELRDLGNTIVMVEHDAHLIRSADGCIELGPGGGNLGGNVLPLQGGVPLSSQGKKRSPLVYKDYDEKTMQLEKNRLFKTSNSFFLKDFSALHCHNISLDIPLGAITTITGPSGAGKSTLLKLGLLGALEQEDLASVPKDFYKGTGILSVDQKPLVRRQISVVATVLKLMDPLRKLFAGLSDSKKLGLTIGDFSFNGGGGCEECFGLGLVEDDLFFLGKVEKVCPVCKGKRYAPPSLVPQFLNKTIADWLETSLEECAGQLAPILGADGVFKMACQLGLGHLPLGIPTTQLSGGEAQRLRLCIALSQEKNKKWVALLDEPTQGLSEKDVDILWDMLVSLSSSGHTFVIVEHHPLFVEQSNHVVWMGPGSGAQGGRIIKRQIYGVG